MLMDLKYELIKSVNFTENIRLEFARLLKLQNKVDGILIEKVDKCKLICIVSSNKKAVAIGGIKRKSKSVFNKLKANRTDLENLFNWELGYIYIEKEVEGNGIATKITSLLLGQINNENLMATTEITANPAMVKILMNNGFELYGSEFKSKFHDNKLGLYLKFANKTV